MSQLVLDAATERVAIELLRHLEWQAEGFSLVFVFADVGPALQLADWLDDRLKVAGIPLQRDEVADSFVRQPENQVDTLIDSLGQRSAQPGAVWLGLHRHPRDEAWNRARTLYLARLNERRFLLERDLQRPLVLVLPADFRPVARSIAPDIWHVRALSEELRAPAPAAGDLPVPALPRENDVTQAARETAEPHGSRAFAEWQRMRAAASEADWFLPIAWRAIDELLSDGRTGDAAEVAGEALAIARNRAAADGSPGADRDLSLALDEVGRVARVQGDWNEAAGAYRESLALSRQLVDRLGGTPETLRDLSVALNNVGRVAQAQGEWDEAAGAYRESLALRRQLVERLGGTPETLRDLSVSLNHVGSVAQARGEWDEAAGAYRESLALRRQLVDRLGGTPETLRDLSISLDHVGRVAQARGEWDEAAGAYRESLALRRQLVDRLGGTPETLSDLAVALLNVSAVSPGEPALRDEAVVIYRMLAERFPSIEEYRQRLAAALAQSDQGNPAE